MLDTVLAGRYRVIERIGSGGTGAVYRARDEQSQSSVAIKLLRPGAARDLEQAARLFEGAWTASLIRHPNIVAVHETGLCDAGPFIVMEDLRGENVGRILERHGRLRPAQALAVIEPVLLALGAAHAVGILHGDVKPENVVLCQCSHQYPTVKLVDFGAGITDNTSRHFVGTTEYLSPEQANLHPIDHRSDLFSTCVLLYELLTNTRPFHGPTASSTTYRIANLPCPSLTESGLPLQDSLWNVLKRGLEKLPAQRYQSCRELLDALRPMMTQELSGARVLGELLPPSLAFADPISIPVASGVVHRPLPQPSLSPESGGRLQGSALPARYRGRHRVRAIVWQALDEYVKARRPPSLRERMLCELSGDEASELRLGTLQGIVYCDLDVVTDYVTRATERLFSGELGWCRAAGREAVDGVLSMALTRSIPPTLSTLVTARRVCRVVAPLFDFGDWQATGHSDPKRVTVTVSDVEPLCVGLRLFFAGIVERSSDVVHGASTVTILRGEGPFTPRLVLELLRS